jgi:predicted nucleic acid-binding protein
VTTVFADSFFFLALLNERDDSHATAVAFSQRRNLRIITTRWVLVEVADALCAPKWRGHAIKLLDHTERLAAFTIVADSDAWFQRGTALFRERSDKHWSLTDCISFVVMADSRLTEALTGDHHFEQAGFTTLL